MKKAFHKAGTRWLQYDTKYHTGGRCAQLVKKHRIFVITTSLTDFKIFLLACSAVNYNDVVTKDRIILISNDSLYSTLNINVSVWVLYFTRSFYCKFTAEYDSKEFWKSQSLLDALWSYEPYLTFLRQQAASVTYVIAKAETLCYLHVRSSVYRIWWFWTR